MRNRMVMTAMTTGFGYESGIPNEDLTAYLRERSAELAMTTVGFGAVAPEGRVENKIPWMWRPEVEDGLAIVTSAIHQGGGLACLQLGHGGRQASPQTAGSQPVAPSPTGNSGKCARICADVAVALAPVTKPAKGFATVVLPR